MDEAKKDKQYRVTISRDRGKDRNTDGTLPELIKHFSYLLEVGQSYEKEKGNKKVNRNPKNIKALITNLYNAKNNAAANGYGGESYD